MSVYSSLPQAMVQQTKESGAWQRIRYGATLALESNTTSRVPTRRPTEEEILMNTQWWKTEDPTGEGSAAPPHPISPSTAKCRSTYSSSHLLSCVAQRKSDLTRKHIQLKQDFNSLTYINASIKTGKLKQSRRQLCYEIMSKSYLVISCVSYTAGALSNKNLQTKQLQTLLQQEIPDNTP